MKVVEVEEEALVQVVQLRELPVDEVLVNRIQKLDLPFPLDNHQKLEEVREVRGGAYDKVGKQVDGLEVHEILLSI